MECCDSWQAELGWAVADATFTEVTEHVLIQLLSYGSVMDSEFLILVPPQKCKREGTLFLIKMSLYMPMFQLTDHQGIGIHIPYEN